MNFNIIFVHLLNDFSGSPRVLKATIDALHSSTCRAKLYLGSSGDGILSRCGIPITRYWYRRMGYRILTFFTYLFSQAVLFCKLMSDRTIDKNAVIYVNTLLPFGAALYGRLTGRKVIYHVHEVSITPAPLKYLLTTSARITSSLNIYVSDAHMKALPIPNVPARRVYNALDADFIEKAGQSTYAHRHGGDFNILMVAALRDYKGIPELLNLAKTLQNQSDVRFDLVVSDDEKSSRRYLKGRDIPPNFIVHSRTNDTATYYARACLVLNLSRVDQCVETFGLTILEAMAFGIPVIVPPVGGPRELVSDGVPGFLVDSRDEQLLRDRVMQLCLDPQLCMVMSEAGRRRAADFSPAVFAEGIDVAIAQVRSMEA